MHFLCFVDFPRIHIAISVCRLSYVYDIKGNHSNQLPLIVGRLYEDLVAQHYPIFVYRKQPLSLEQ
jgi:hypothetical protein